MSQSKIDQKIIKFFSEIGVIKRMQHEGFRLAGIDDPHTLETHVIRSAQIGFVLACLEGIDPYKVATMNVFHDNEEIRIGDQTKVAARYFSTKPFKNKALTDQLKNLPKEIADKIYQLVQEHDERHTKEGIVAKDADWLEVAMSAKEYLEIGYKGMQEWIDNVRKALETESAKKILDMVETEPEFLTCWWQGLKKMTYKKLKKK